MRAVACEIGDVVDLSKWLWGLAAFLILAVALTLLGAGGAAGNATGILFWALLVVLAVSFVLSWWRTGEEESVRVARRIRTRDRR